MKYYLIVGEASGDIHAAGLMHSLKKKDPEAEFRFFGGDLMAAEGGTMVKHYKELAYMGFVPVLLHLRTIFRNMDMCKQDIVDWQPDVVILVDYPGFNLKIAKFVHAHTRIPVYYYISPKIWAWKEWRIKSIKRDVSELFSILPFEVPFFEEKHHFPIHYVGNPTAYEVSAFKKKALADNDDFLRRYLSYPSPPMIAILCGSRQQEIKDNLPAMLAATRHLADSYQLVIAGAPAIEHEYYQQFTKGYQVKVLPAGWTHQLLFNATAALVTSGTATLETALFNVPQVVCYKTPVPHLIRFAFNHIIQCKYISLVNLIADKEVVPELLADRFSVEDIRNELMRILPGGDARQEQLDGYEDIMRKLGDTVAPDNAASIMVKMLKR